MAQAVKHRTFDSSSGHDLGSSHDLRVGTSSPTWESVLGMEWNSLKILPLGKKKKKILPLAPLKK